MKQTFFFIYGVIAYTIFLVVYSYFVLWENNTLVPTGVDFGARLPLFQSILVDTLVMALFFVPHSLMARKSFKAWWTKLIPEAIERSTYILFSSLLMGIWIYFWQPIPIVLYDLSGSWMGKTLLAISFIGFGLTVFSTFLINHFELFGLQQVYQALNNQIGKPYQFVTPLLYKLVRHPLYFSFMIAFWVNPILTVGHLLLASLVTIYTLIGIEYEEKDLKEVFGKQYEAYLQKTPKLIPVLFKFKTEK